MTEEFRRAIELLDARQEVRRHLADDPKATVLYWLPHELGIPWFDSDDQLELVDLGERLATRSWDQAIAHLRAR